MKTRKGAARGAAPRRATALAAALGLLIAVPAQAHAPRVPELVSPADNTGDMGQLGLLTADGEHAGYTSSGAFSGAPQTGAPITYLAARTPVGWATTPVVTPSPTAVRAIADSGHGVVWQSADPADPADTSTNSADLFFRDGAGPLTRLSSGSLNTHGVNATFAAANASLSSVFFESATALEPPDDARHGTGTGLYEWRAGTLANIAVPDANAAKGGAVLGGGPQRTRTGALSADGSRIVLTSPSVSSAGNRLRLWVRDTPNGPIAPLIATAPTQDQLFDGASADGSIVLLSTKEALTNGDTDGTQSDLWSVQVATGAISRVSTGGDASSCTAPKLTGCEARAVAISADGSTVAFVSGESLAAGATANAPNLYVHRGTTTRFIATIATTDAALNVAPPGSETRISADGSRLFFLSAAKLTADDTDASPDLYAADTATGALTRLSQGPAGGNAAAPVLLSSPKPGYVPTSQQVVAPRAISDDGRCAFFETVEGLVAEDTNGDQDVYENCDGVTALLSAGTGTAPSHLINNSADGRDVLIVTTDVLSTDDRDGGASLYDLRAGGRAVPTPPTGCSGDACQGAPTSPSERPAVASFGATSAESSSGAPGALLIVRQPSLAARKAATKRGQIEVVADMPGAGQFDVTVKARMKGKMKTVAHGKATATKAGPVRLRIALPKSVRRALRRKAISVRITGHFVGAGVDTTDVASYVLPRRRSGK